MLSLIVVSLVAGVCFGQQSSKYAACETLDSIASQCATSNLDYIKSEDDLARMKQLALLDRPDVLLARLDVICNDTVGLKKYYVCALANLTVCLREKNSTEYKGVADPDTLAMGVVDMCEARSEMNKTCLIEAVVETQTCFGKAMSELEPPYDPCTPVETLVGCADLLTGCDGGQAMKDFVISSRPSTCPDPTAAAPRYLPSFLMLLMAMLLAHSITIQ